jgi:hypothetical protein
VTNPDQDPVSHAEELENIVDRLGEKVANELEAEQAETRGPEEEPPD